MSAQWKSATSAGRLLPLTIADLDAVLAVEVRCYAFPWSRGNFIDSIAAGYMLQRLCDDDDRQLGYFVAMAGVDELHLLNITVAPEQQGQGHARHMLDELATLARRGGARQVWLEVRESNARARAIYLRYGFRQLGVRRGYYPAAHGQREDAAVMSLALGAPHGVHDDALD
jgi:ribosomal-protein-alanine N-acetyltransferase